MNQSNIVQQARRGNVDAIAALLGNSLKSHGISVYASHDNECLRILLKAEKLPKKLALSNYIYQGICKLNISAYKELVICGQHSDEQAPSWRQQFTLSPSTNHTSADPSQASVDPSITKVNAGDSHPDSNTPKGSSVSQSPPHETKSILSVFTEVEQKPLSARKTPPSKAWRRLTLVIFICLWIQIVLNALFLIHSLASLLSQGLYTALGVMDSTGLVFLLLYPILNFMDGFWTLFESINIAVSRLNFLILAVWMYFFHQRLGLIFSSYPIKPSGAIARYIIPIYNFFGIWSIFSTLSNHLKRESNTSLKQAGKRISSYLTWLYVALVVSMINQTSYHIMEATRGSIGLPLVFFVWVNLVLLVHSVLHLGIIKISFRATC